MFTHASAGMSLPFSYLIDLSPARFQMSDPTTMKQDPAWVYLRQTPEEMLAIQGRVKYDPKKSVWVADSEEGFVFAEIKSTKGDQIVVQTAKGTEKTLNKDEVQQMNPPKYELTEDMSNLTFLNEGSVLHNLRQRYYTMMIYVGIQY